MAAFDLASRCITYLCQSHHDLELADDQFYKHVRNGDYVLDWFASNMWDRLIQYSLDETDTEGETLEAVAAELGNLFAARQNHSSSAIDHADMSSHYAAFSEDYPELDMLLHHRKEFRRITESSEHRMALDAPWIDFDPLTTSKLSVRLYTSLPALPFRDEEEFKSNAVRIQRWHGTRPYKCGFLHCSFHRTGFESVGQRRSHENHHEKPWKCSIPGCEFEEGGFLSKKMRDDHLERAHRTITHTPLPVYMNTEETKLVLLDLAKEGLIDDIKRMFPEDFVATHGHNLWFANFCNAAGLSGSTPLLKFCLSSVSHLEAYRFFGLHRPGEFVKALTRPSTVDLFKEFIDLSWVGKQPDYYLDLFSSLLTSETRPHFEHWLDGWAKIKKGNGASNHRQLFNMVKATDNDSLKEERLLQLLRSTVPMKKLCIGGEGTVLVLVAHTTRSCRLAKYLLDRGAQVDYRMAKDTAFTALFAATSEDSAKAAALTKLLLLHGADPETTRVGMTGKRDNWTKTTLKVRDQKGAKGIQKWLGMTWDQLVADVQRQRKEGLETLNDK